MRRFSPNVVAFLLLATSAPGQLPALAPSAPPATRSTYGDKLKLVGLRNAGRINEHLYRGAQPRAEGLQELKKLGITTIVDLRSEDPNKLDWERHQAESLGIRFVSIPVNGWAPPSDAQVARFLALFRNNPDEKIFVHCRFGDDRTGVFVATYRMAYDGWSARQAMNEMYFFGFNGVWHPSMKTFVNDFHSRMKSSPILEERLPDKQVVTKCNDTPSAAPCSN